MLGEYYIVVTDKRESMVAVGWAPLSVFMTDQHISACFSGGVLNISRGTWAAAGYTGDPVKVPIVNPYVGWVLRGNKWKREGAEMPRPKLQVQ